MYKEILAKLTAREELSGGEIAGFIGAVNNNELSEAQIAGFLVALTMKGVTVGETVAIARAVRENCLPLKPRVQAELMDTCGTGGGLGTFNISTATAVVAAAGGIPVAKHGSRSISSLSGSADVLEALGVEINLGQRAVEKMIEEIGIAFIYAPLFNPVMCKVLPPETALGIKTIFYSIIGPLINPAFAPRHLMGVHRADQLDTVSQVAKNVGFTHAMFVHGLDGLDEISLLGKTRIHELKHGDIEVYEVAPEDFGLTRCTLEEIKQQKPEISAEIIQGVFSGRLTGPKRDVIVLNAAGALKVGGKAVTFVEGIALANHLIDSGAADRKLRQLREMSHSFHGWHTPKPDTTRDENAVERQQPPLTAERELAELREIAKLWRGVLQSSQDAIVVIRMDGSIEKTNDIAAKLCGLGEEVAPGRNYYELLGAETRNEHREFIERAFAAGKAARWEAQWNSKSFLNIAFPIMDGNRCVILSRDITAQKLVEESAQNKRARLSTLIETLPDMIWLKDTEGRYVNCNHKFERFLGATEAAIKGKTENAFLPDAQAELFRRDAVRALQEHRTVVSRDWITYASDGHREFVEIVNTPFVDSRGVLKGVMGFARDVTGFKQAEEELNKHRNHLEELVRERTAELQQAHADTEAAYRKLVELEKLRDDLVHMVVHDMRSPLAGLGMFLDSLSPEEVNAPDFAEHVRLMREASNGLSDMVTSLLDISRLEAGQMPLHCKTSDLGQLTIAAQQRLSGLIPGRHLAVRASVPPVLAYCDPDITERIFQNLLGNALKFTPIEGSIRIDLAWDEQWARFSISDNGPGIPPEYHEKVFQKFGQVELRKNRKVPSSGLGLAFCKLAVEAQGGNIQLQSEPARGTTFHVHLPRYRPGTSF